MIPRTRVGCHHFFSLLCTCREPVVHLEREVAPALLAPLVLVVLMATLDPLVLL